MQTWCVGRQTEYLIFDFPISCTHQGNFVVCDWMNILREPLTPWIWFLSRSGSDSKGDYFGGLLWVTEVERRRRWQIHGKFLKNVIILMLLFVKQWLVWAVGLGAQVWLLLFKGQFSVNPFTTFGLCKMNDCLKTESQIFPVFLHVGISYVWTSFSVHSCITCKLSP